MFTNQLQKCLMRYAFINQFDHHNAMEILLGAVNNQVDFEKPTF